MLSLITLTLFHFFYLVSLGWTQSCSDGWKQFQNKCFLYYPDKSFLTFYEAHIACKDFYNSTLVSIHSDEEQQFLTKMAFTTYKANNHVWIGARRQSNDTFSWEDNTEFNYTYWAKTQPNNLEGKHYCASLLQSTNLAELGNWYDDPCSDKYNFICQRYITPPAVTADASNSNLSEVLSKHTMYEIINSTFVNSSTLSAIIASRRSERTVYENSRSANSILIVITIVQFLIIGSLIFVILRKSLILPSYRTLVMSECTTNSV